MHLHGIVINPLTKELIISFSYFVGEINIFKLDSDYDNDSIIGKADFEYNGENTDGYNHPRKSKTPFYLSGFPRIHTKIVHNKIGKGYGTALYASSTLRFINSRDIEKSGISSSPESRNDESDKWWKKAVDNNIAEEINTIIKVYENESIDSVSHNPIFETKLRKLIEEEKNIPSEKITLMEYNLYFRYRDERPFTYNILRTSSAIKAGWVGLYTTKKISTIEEINSSNSVLCNIGTFINADWTSVTKSTKDKLFNIIVELSHGTSSKKDIDDLRISIYAK